MEVHPERGSRGVGTALLREAVGAFSDTTDLRRGLHRRPDLAGLLGAQRLPARGRAPGLRRRPGHRRRPPVPRPTGYAAVTLDPLPDLRMLLATHNLAAVGRPERAVASLHDVPASSPTGGTAPTTPPSCPSALLDVSGAAPVLASFTSVQVDRARRRAWTAMTGHPPGPPAARSGALGQAAVAQRRRGGGRDAGRHRQRRHQRPDGGGQHRPGLPAHGPQHPGPAPAALSSAADAPPTRRLWREAPLHPATLAADTPPTRRLWRRMPRRTRRVGGWVWTRAGGCRTRSLRWGS